MRRRTASSYAVVALAAAAMLLVIMRNYRPPNRALAFPHGEIVVGVDASYPPFALDAGGVLSGLDIDLASAIGAELDMPVRFRNIGFYGLYDALLSGEVDILISALRIDPMRADLIHYTQHYFNNALLLVTSADKPLSDIEQLSGRDIAYEHASLADSRIRLWEQGGIEARRLPYELPVYALDALRLGPADAALVDATTYRLYRREHPGWAAPHRFISLELYAIALRHDQDDAWRLVNGVLSTLKDSGELARIINKWL